MCSRWKYQKADRVFHQIHGCQNFIENTLAAASVVDLLEAFQRQGEGDIAELLNRLTELLVDQGSIGEAVEFTVMMLFCQTQDVFLRTSGSPPVNM